MVVVGLVVAGIILVIGRNAGWFGTKKASVSGSIVYTALKPSPGDKGTVHLYVKEQSSSGEFQDTGVEIPLVANQTWEWPNAVEGKIYQMQAGVVIDGNVVKRSDIQTVAAPASSVDLAIRVNWRDLPEDVRSTSNLAIGGTVAINGYIPSRSSLQIYEVENTQADGQPLNIGDQLQSREKLVQSIVNPTNTSTWSWPAAVPLKSYVFRAVLKDASGNQIGESEQVVNVEASDQQVSLIINSSAQPATTTSAVQPSPTTTTFAQITSSATPQPSATAVASAVPSPSPAAAPAPSAKISGVVYLNGPKAPNTSLLMLWRPAGVGNYNVINRYMYPPQSGTTWEFDGATAGQRYDIQAALQVNGQNTSTAPVPVTVTAPAMNINFTLNTNFLVPAPNTQPIFQTCINNNQAVITLPAISNAGRYWVQVGNNNTGDSSYANTQLSVSPNAGDQKITVAVNRGQQSFVRYSYAECTNCTDVNNFSPWSTTVGFTCN
jgi:hypothetical protein